MITNETFVGLVAAACEWPADDTPRMVLADYLDDTADRHTDPEAASAWAAYIRWDCGGRKGAEPDGLLAAVSLGGWFDVARMEGMRSITLTRGFPGGFRVSWEDWQRVGHLLSWHPDEFEKSGRACPPTACPGVEVMLRSPVIDDRCDVTLTGHLAAGFLEARWPGVKAWHLPDVPRYDSYSRMVDTLAASGPQWPSVGPRVYGTPTAGNYAAAVEGLRVFNERLYGRPAVTSARAFLHIDPADTEE